MTIDELRAAVRHLEGEVQHLRRAHRFLSRAVAILALSGLLLYIGAIG